MAVQFHFADAHIRLTQRTALKDFLKTLFKKECQNLNSLTYIFCSDEYLLNINQDFLKHDYYTDIITFNLSPTPDSITGEIYISVDRVKDNANTLQQPVRHELHRVIFHGALHLCGYKDKSKKEQILMRAMEDRCLKLYL